LIPASSDSAGPGSVAAASEGAAAEGAAAVERLDALTRRLRRECPWDREQDERSIVPHTVEEAYELADAAHAGDDARMLDELGDVLFQVHFLALLLEERGSGDLAAVADHCARKLVRRHPHVFGDVEADDAATVLRNWDRIKEGEEGAENGPSTGLPATIYARKAQRRTATEGVDPPTADAALAEVSAEARLLALPDLGRDARFRALGELLYAAVAAARDLGADPELALRAAADRRLAAATGSREPTR
jgi:MazG family protein